ncbi:HopJ type III effector protein [Solimonas flava]|uniref:HopJ type III effector protein n=1 Tax=Solimonas flava TaxID=415849 RepID=UPI000425CD6D|nr:HopJ type III effector protein [Solimonas flava]
MSVDAFLKRLREAPEQIEFSETIAAIDGAYDYTPTAFRNGDLHNEAGQNAGSCKLFSFAQLQGLTEAETLACFGRYYRDDVLKNPDGTEHQNIRNFMRTGWKEVQIGGDVLKKRCRD